MVLFNNRISSFFVTTVVRDSFRLEGLDSFFPDVVFVIKKNHRFCLQEWTCISRHYKTLTLWQ